MGRRLIIIVILACIGSFPVYAGDTVVSGPVSGLWSAGQVVVVNGPMWIPVGEELQIEAGVHVTFLTLDSVVVDGRLIAQGSVGNPVILSVPNGWEGLQFSPNLGHHSKLACVFVGVEGGLPLRVVTASSALLVISDCNFRAKETCVDIDGGSIRAFRNVFTTTGMLSKTVRLRNLHRGDYAALSCNDADASTLACGNMLSAIVPDENQPAWGQVFTTALDVSDCSRLCLDSVFITVDAPCMAVGAHFRYESEYGTPVFGLSRSTVTVRSPRGQPFGLLGTESGMLNVIHCNIDVANPLDVSGFQPSGMQIWGRADIYVNSSVVTLDKGQRWFAPREDATGLITVSHVDKWSSNVAAMSQPVVQVDDGQNGHEIVVTAWNKNAIIENGPVYYSDPQFLHEGEWGAWEKPEDMQAYYGLQSSSPCIDKADVFYGNDPDNTPPDIGQFYFPQSPIDTSAGTEDNGALVLRLELNAPYPNPFNAVSIVPFSLTRSGNVEVVVFDLLGRKVATLATGQMQGGGHVARFAADNLPSGLYIVSLKFEGARVGNRPLLLLK